MNLDNPIEQSNLLGAAGLIGVLIWFCRRFLDRWENSQKELIAALQGVLRENNELLTAVRSHLAGDTAHVRKSAYEHVHDQTRQRHEAAD